MLLQWNSVPPKESQGNLYVKGFDIRPQTIGLGRKRQMETKSVSVCLTPTKLAAVLPSDTRALLPHSSTDSDRYTGTTTIRDQRTETHIKPHRF